jgi:hypothetical protein
MLLSLLFHAALTNQNLVCGPVVDVAPIGSAHRYESGAPLVDKRGVPGGPTTAAPQSCRSQSEKPFGKTIIRPVEKVPSGRRHFPSASITVV